MRAQRAFALQLAAMGPGTSVESPVPPGVALEEVPCPACGEREGAVVIRGRDVLHGVAGQFQVMRCAGCGLMRTNPRPTLDSVGAYYPDDYQPFGEESPGDVGPLRRLARRAMDSLDWAIPDLPPGHLLEIGSAAGNFLLAMQHRGWSVTGVEPHKATAERSIRRVGPCVTVAPISEVDFPRGGYDLVCAWMTLEHVHEPVELLRRVRTWLRPRGWLAFSVPDAASWQRVVFGPYWYALQLPAHLFHFTPASLRRLLSSLGYVDVRVRHQRTQIDVAASLGLALEQAGLPAARRLAFGAPSRGLFRLLGVLTGPLGLTGRLTVWARRPDAS